MRKIVIIFMTFFAILNLLSCKKDEDPSSELVVDKNHNLSLRFSTTVGDQPLKYQTEYLTENNERYTISSFRFYVSDIRLIKADGSEHPLTNRYLLITPTTEKYDLGSVPAGSYKGIKFAVGIDSVTNHSDPTIYPPANPLAIQSPAMHWSWNSGYIFTMVEGTCDTTTSNTDTLYFNRFSKPMFFHIGMDMMYRNVEFDNSPFSVDKPKELRLTCDLNKFFTGIELKKENQTHTMMTVPLASKAANNYGKMFQIKE